MVGLSASMSGRAPSTIVALPTNTLPLRGSDGALTNGGVGSPGCRSRHSSTRSTATSSTVQPVTAIDPCSPVAPAAGVSIRPVGAAGAAGRFSRTLTVDVAVAAPAYVTVTAPLTVLPAGGNVETYRTPIDSAAGPEPDDGLTISHGASDTAVQVTVFCAPVWAIFTVSAGVWDVNLVPEFTAPKFSDALSTTIVGGTVSSGTTVNITPLLDTPPTVSVTFPVVAPLGTGTVMLAADHDVGVAATPLNATRLAPCVDSRFAPVIV